jgi:ATP-dependent DNA helicase RecG
MPQLEVLLAQPEGKRLEYKRDLSSPGPVLRSLTAFANSAGGTMVIGVDDDRSVRGLADPMAVEHRLVNLISDSIAPKLVPEIDIVRWRSTNLIIVTVHLSGSRPHRILSDDSVYVRLGASNRRADPELIEEMRRSTRFESFDELPYPSETVDSLSFETVRAEFASTRKVRRADLAVLGLSVGYQGSEVPTIGGLILFGRDRVAFPDATIRCARFDGTTRTRILDTRELTGSSLPESVRQ